MAWPPNWLDGYREAQGGRVWHELRQLGSASAQIAQLYIQHRQH
jgi:hypothetical protein